MDIKPCNILLKKDIIKKLEDAIEVKELLNLLYIIDTFQEQKLKH